MRGLYLVTDENGDGRLIDKVGAALQAGCRTVQYRNKTADEDRKRDEAQALAHLCRDAGARFLINDSVELAQACAADGVHLGQGDMPASQARKLLGPGKIVGVSTHTPAEAQRACADGADYLGVGSIFPTSTKDDASLIGLEALTSIRRATDLPLVAIGGISRENAPQVIEAGADSIAVISAVMGDAQPGMAVREFNLLFNRRAPWPRGRVLTIAGSDSGGGAGIQADIKTATLLGSYAASVLTALTAQNTLGVSGIHAAPTSFVSQQIGTVLSDIAIDVIKTGMLFDAGIIRATATAIAQRGLPAVVDPVMIAKGGASLLQNEAVSALIDHLLPHTYLLTPNIPEAEALTGRRIASEADMEMAAKTLQEMGARNVLVKGGHLPGEAVDLLLDGTRLHRFSAPRTDTANTHGTGCTFSTAIATFLAQGLPLYEAVTSGKAFISEAIRCATPLGAGHGPVNHFAAARLFTADADDA